MIEVEDSGRCDPVVITGERDYFVVCTNSDRTEGRGHRVPLHVCEGKATAQRLAKGVGVQGSDGSIQKIRAFMIGGMWFAPVHHVAIVHRATPEDERAERDDCLKQLAIAKLSKAGLTDEEMAILGVKP